MTDTTSGTRDGEDAEMTDATRGIEHIAAERERQIDVEGYDADHDAGNKRKLALAAAAYALFAAGEVSAANSFWPWDRYAFKPGPDAARDLVKAGALAAAAIDADG